MNYTDEIVKFSITGLSISRNNFKVLGGSKEAWVDILRAGINRLESVGYDASKFKKELTSLD